jgi:ABC-2 type transport system ATP-binding protein
MSKTSKFIVEFKHVEKCFKSLVALQDVSFTLKPGEIFGLIGPNGSGKTTAVRLMLGFYTPTNGTVRIFGNDPSTEFHRFGPRVGIMLEQPGILEKLTAREYLEYFGALLRIPSGDLHPRVCELLQLVGLSDHANIRLGQFSKGMRQRISLSRCLLNCPQLMVLDEPFDGLDIESRRLMLDILPQVSKERQTTVFVTSHNLAEVEEISDRIAIIKQGRILAVDRMDSLRERVTKGRVLVVNLAHDYTEENISQLVPEAEYCRKTHDLMFNLDVTSLNQDELLMRLLKSGISINSVGGESASLEEVYFALTKMPPT